MNHTEVTCVVSHEYEKGQVLRSVYPHGVRGLPFGNLTVTGVGYSMGPHYVLCTEQGQTIRAHVLDVEGMCRLVDD